MDAGIAICDGFRPEQSTEVTQIYAAAFGPKLGRILGRGMRAQRFLAASLDADFALCAVDMATGAIVGIAGYRTERGGLTDRFGVQLRVHYGWAGAFWRGALLRMLETVETPEKLLIDGIAVAPGSRGRGIGTRLLVALEDRARDLGKSALRLDVIDRNVRARELYARAGYEVSGSHDLGPLRHAFGFRRATQMTKML